MKAFSHTYVTVQCPRCTQMVGFWHDGEKEQFIGHGTRKCEKPIVTLGEAHAFITERARGRYLGESGEGEERHLKIAAEPFEGATDTMPFYERLNPDLVRDWMQCQSEANAWGAYSFSMEEFGALCAGETQ